MDRSLSWSPLFVVDVDTEELVVACSEAIDSVVVVDVTSLSLSEGIDDITLVVDITSLRVRVAEDIL